MSHIRVTQIGSLPHHNVDSAIEYSLQHEIPFFPQIPKARPQEFMVQQALEHLPGLQVSDKMECLIELKTWLKNKDNYQKKLDKAFESENYDEFSPGPELSSCWKAFLFELEERDIKTAKIQIAGPFTSQLVCKLTDGDTIKDLPELQSQVFKTIWAQAMCMYNQVKNTGVKEVIFFLDEPALYFLGQDQASFSAYLQELRILIMALKKAGAKTGIHCCSNTSWESLLTLPISYLSIDVELSLDSLLLRKEQLVKFIEDGGKLSLGIFPTDKKSQVTLNHHLTRPLHDLETILGKKYVDCLKDDMIITPACGLAYHNAAKAEEVFEFLNVEKEEVLGS